MRLRCFTCGKSVSTELPEETIFRAVATCCECIEEEWLAENEKPGIADDEGEGGDRG